MLRHSGLVGLTQYWTSPFWLHIWTCPAAGQRNGVNETWSEPKGWSEILLNWIVSILTLQKVMVWLKDTWRRHFSLEILVNTWREEHCCLDSLGSKNSRKNEGKNMNFVVEFYGELFHTSFNTWTLCQSAILFEIGPNIYWNLDTWNCSNLLSHVPKVFRPLLLTVIQSFRFVRLAV